MGQEFPISGSLDPASFPFLLANLHQQGATGSLKVDGATYQKALYFRGGRVLFGSSNDPRDQLGAILIESGRLTSAQLDEASAKVGPGNPLAKVLSDGGLVTQRELGEAAKLKVERILCDLLTIDDGSFEFEDDVLPKGAIDLKLPTQRLFVSALRRVPESAFVRRHLGGPDVVLRVVSAASERLAEVFGDVAGLPDVFDGRRTLREAAALAKVDADEAGRLACALLFLGLVEKAPQDTFQAIESEEDELDFAPTARINLADLGSDDGASALDGDAPFFLSGDAAPALPPSAPPLAIDPAVFAPAEPVPEPETTTDATLVLPRARDAEPTVRLPPPPAPEPEVEPTVVLRAPAPRPAAPELPLVPPPAAAPRPAPSALPLVPPPARPKPGALPLVPPPPRGPVSRPGRPGRSATDDVAEPTLAAPTVAARPSREDLEALDSLLNARPLETPLAGATSADGSGPVPAARRAPAWEPSFGRGTTARGPKAPVGRAAPSRLPLVVGGVTVVVLLAAAGGWYWLTRARPTAPAPSPRQQAGIVKPRPLPGDVTATPSAPASPDVAPSVPPLATPVASAAPTAAPATPEPRAATGAPDQARAALRAGDLAAAGRGFTATLRAAPGGTHSIQLLLACSAETIAKAVAATGADELFVVPIRYRGRDCHRVCWGLYDSRARAESALRSVPPYFRAEGAQPRVMPAPELLR